LNCAHQHDTSAGVADLTFASVSPRVGEANVKSETTPESFMFAGVPLVLTLVNEPAAIRMSEPGTPEVNCYAGYVGFMTPVGRPVRRLDQCDGSSLNG
jgi:hypothetical protein